MSSTPITQRRARPIEGGMINNTLPHPGPEVSPSIVTLCAMVPSCLSLQSLGSTGALSRKHVEVNI